MIVTCVIIHVEYILVGTGKTSVQTLELLTQGDKHAELWAAHFFLQVNFCLLHYLDFQNRLGF